MPPARTPPAKPDDGRSSKAVAYQWATRVITVSMEMVIPGLLGYWADQRLGTVFVFTIIGFTLGLILGIWHLLKIANHQNNRSKNKQADIPR